MTTKRSPKKRTSYHHGDLRTALIEAADAIIAEGGIEAFSLRAAAQRAGVSPGAPAHHFGNARGLLTEVGLLAYKRLEGYVNRVDSSEDVVAEVRTLSLAFLDYALDHPGHFRLMFRYDLIDRADPRFAAYAMQSGGRINRAFLAYRGKMNADMHCFGDAADALCAMATLHGLASLTLEGKALHFFRSPDARSFRKNELPRIIEHLYPDHPKPAPKKKPAHS